MAKFTEDLGDKRFTQSLLRFQEQLRTTAALDGPPTEGLDASLSRFASKQPDFQSAMALSIATLVKLPLHHAESVMSRMVGICESPIERAMLHALIATTHCYDFSQTLVVDGVAHEFGDRSNRQFRIEPQHKVGNYRIDFRVAYSEVVLDEIDPPNGVPGVQKTITREILIECDGHDFHERTKQQAAHDRKKDRALQSAGFRIYRYTGSEIFADVFKCAHEVVSKLVDELTSDVLVFDAEQSRHYQTRNAVEGRGPTGLLN